MISSGRRASSSGSAAQWRPISITSSTRTLYGLLVPLLSLKPFAKLDPDCNAVMGGRAALSPALAYVGLLVRVSVAALAKLRGVRRGHRRRWGFSVIAPMVVVGPGCCPVCLSAPIRLWRNQLAAFHGLVQRIAVGSIDQFIDENGGGPGVRLRKRPLRKPKAI